MTVAAVPAAGRRRELRLRPRLEELGRARSFAEVVAVEHGCPATAVHDIRLAVSEAVANAIEHGSPCDDGSIHVWAAIDADRLTFGVRDGGTFAIRPSATAERGRGLASIAVLMDELVLRCRDGQTTIELTRRR